MTRLYNPGKLGFGHVRHGGGVQQDIGPDLLSGIAINATARGLSRAAIKRHLPADANGLRAPVMWIEARRATKALIRISSSFDLARGCL